MTLQGDVQCTQQGREGLCLWWGEAGPQQENEGLLAEKGEGRKLPAIASILL